jgi:hypothetical protein
VGPTDFDRENNEPASVLSAENETNIINYIEQLKKDGKAPSTIFGRTRSLRQFARVCNLSNPEEVKARALCQQ